MYNFFINSEIFRNTTSLLGSQLESFETAFKRHADKELEDTAGLFGNWTKKLNLDFFTNALTEFTKGLNRLHTHQNRFIETSANHARFLDSAIHCQYAALYIALIRAENSTNSKEQPRIDAALKDSLAGIQATLIQYERFAKHPAIHDALQIMNFVKNLLSENNPLNNKIYGEYYGVRAKKKEPGIPNFIQSICRPSTSTQTTLYDPQLYLRNLLHNEFRQFQPSSSEKTYKKFSHQFTAYYLNLMFIAATINDGRTHFLGLDRISWDAYLNSICVEIADFFSIENQSGRASPLPTGAFTINKEQAVVFLKDSLQYQPLLQPRPTSPFAPVLSVSAPQPIPSPVQRSSSSTFMPVQASAATLPRRSSPVFQTPPRPSIQEAIVLYNYTAGNTDEISCTVGERLVLANPSQDYNKIGQSEWVRVQKQDGDVEIYNFPGNYLKLV